MGRYQTPYRYDFAGSFLRPQEVKQAAATFSLMTVHGERQQEMPQSKDTRSLVRIWTK